MKEVASQSVGSRRWGVARSRGWVIGLFVIAGLAGCGESGMMPETLMRAEDSPATIAAAEGQARAAGFVADKVAAPAAPGGPDGGSPAPPPGLPRKIIYDGHVDLVTDDMARLEKGLLALVASSKGYLARSEVQGATGEPRSGSWTARVPVDGYEGFLQAVAKLGEVASLRTDSKDVSAEFYDLGAREKAKKVEEERLIKHLSDSTGKLEDILAVERELSRVRGEIEQIQGRLRVMSDLTALTTVTITAREVRGYTPPQSPTLAAKVARSFAGSIDALRLFGEGLLLLVVAVLPWAAMIGVLGVVLMLMIRAMRRRGREGVV